MKIDTAYNHMRNFQVRAREIYASARMFGQSHAWILERLEADVYGVPAWRKCPGWVRERTGALISELADDLYRPHVSASDLARVARDGDTSRFAFLIWVHRVDGEILDSSEISSRRAAGDDDIWDRVESAHVWNNKRDRAFSPFQTARGRCAA